MLSIPYTRNCPSKGGEYNTTRRTTDCDCYRRYSIANKEGLDSRCCAGNHSRLSPLQHAGQTFWQAMPHHKSLACYWSSQNSSQDIMGSLELTNMIPVVDTLSPGTYNWLSGAVYLEQKSREAASNIKVSEPSQKSSDKFVSSTNLPSSAYFSQSIRACLRRWSVQCCC